MKLDTFFIVNVLLLVALVVGASYLQANDADKNQGREETALQNQNPVPTAESSGWHLSTTIVSASANATPAVVQTAPTPAPKPVSKPAARPSVRRVYNEDDD